MEYITVLLKPFYVSIHFMVLVRVAQLDFPILVVSTLAVHIRLAVLHEAIGNPELLSWIQHSLSIINHGLSRLFIGCASSRRVDLDDFLAAEPGCPNGNIGLTFPFMFMSLSLGVGANSEPAGEAHEL